MTQKLLCLCAVCALFFVFATANVANADDVVAPVAGCPCGMAKCYFNPCCPPTAYRVGMFGAVRPIGCAPVCAPICPPVYAPICPPVYRPVVMAPRYYRPWACAPGYCW